MALIALLNVQLPSLLFFVSHLSPSPSFFLALFIFLLLQHLPFLFFPQYLLEMVTS